MPEVQLPMSAMGQLLTSQQPIEFVRFVP
jgi:hypothetical protein